MRKTSDRLVDGREIIYYDAAPVVWPAATDRRDLPPALTSSELRFDPVMRTWVMYSSNRQHRTYLPPAEECPLCPSAEGRATEIPRGDYEVAVFENRFPALTSDDHWPGLEGEGGEVLARRPSAGRCEVVCYTADHNSSFAQLEPARTDLVIDVLIDRTRELSAMGSVQQVFCFENRGPEIGVTLPHPHGQIYAYPFIPLRMERLLASAASYRRRCHANLYDDLVQAERDDGARVVLSTAHWTAFVPHAARWPYEVHCYPHRRAPDLESLDPLARAELPEVLHSIFGRFARLFDTPAPYVAGWYQAPVRRGRAEFAVHLELFTVRRANDRLKYLAGSESGMEAFANDILPEDAANRLRQVVV